jgi:hypothetical protein
VERPQPEARTYDLDAGAGWRMLDVEDEGSVVSSRQRREFRIRFPLFVREGRLGCRDICSPTVGRMVRFGHDHRAQSHTSASPAGSHADTRARLRVVSERLTPRDPEAGDFGVGLAMPGC